MQLTLVAIAVFASVAFAIPTVDNENKTVIDRPEQSASPKDHSYDYNYKYYDEYKHHKPGKYDEYHEHKPGKYYEYHEDKSGKYDEYHEDKPGKYYEYHEDKPDKYDEYHEDKPGKYDEYHEHKPGKYYEYYEDKPGKYDEYHEDKPSKYDEYHEDKPGKGYGYHEDKPENYNHYDGNSNHDKRRVNYRKRKTYTVVVGGPNILAYNPPQIFAKKGDKIIFKFMEKNHTLTSSEFHTPCTPNGRVDTGFVANLNNTVGIAREFYVKHEKPQWFFCRQATHCSKGMVFALNPTYKNTFKEFQQLALETASKDSGVAIPPFHGQNNMF